MTIRREILGALSDLRLCLRSITMAAQAVTKACDTYRQRDGGVDLYGPRGTQIRLPTALEPSEPWAITGQ